MQNKFATTIKFVLKEIGKSYIRCTQSVVFSLKHPKDWDNPPRKPFSHNDLNYGSLLITDNG